jgi:hypothetical protein
MAPKRKNTQNTDVDDNDTTDWASLTVVNLKAELVQRGLPVSGNKAALVERLDAADGAGKNRKNVPRLLRHSPTMPEESIAANSPSSAAQPDARTDWSGMTVAQLKAELSNRGLPVSGNKTTLLNRLDDADSPAQPKKAKSTPASPNGIYIVSPIVGHSADNLQSFRWSIRVCWKLHFRRRGSSAATRPSS